MNKIDQIVCSLDNSKKLKLLNVSQESYFYYNRCQHCTEEYGLEEEFYLQEGQTHGENISALTVQELLPHLKESWVTISNGYDRLNNFLTVHYEPDGEIDNSYFFEGHNLADLLAQALIVHIEIQYREDESE